MESASTSRAGRVHGDSTRPKRFYKKKISDKKEDMETLGYTAACPGCTAVKRGTTATTHSEECGKRFAEELDKVGDEVSA